MNEIVNIKNGVNVDQLVGTIEAIKGDSDIARFQFRSKTKWINGGHCRTECLNVANSILVLSRCFNDQIKTGWTYSQEV